MGLYTFIMDFKGGCYISQLKAKDQFAAMRKWLKNLEINEIPGFSLKEKDRLIRENFEDEEPVRISETINVWHFLVRVGKYYGYINFVLTQPN